MKKMLSLLASILAAIFFMLYYSSQLGSHQTTLHKPNRMRQQAAYLPDAVIVKFKSKAQLSSNFEQTLVTGLSAIDRQISQIGVNEVEAVFKPIKKSFDYDQLGLSNIYRLRYVGPDDALHVAEVLSRDPAVAYAEPVYLQEAQTDPNDKLYSAQWYLQSVKAPQGWDVEKGDSTVIIAIIDTGVDIKHPDLAGKIWINADEIPNNKIDDDANGFVDDINGWDFEKRNADPSPDPDGVDNDSDGLSDDGVDHGTSMAGLAAAMTNNNEGIAGFAWNCQIMPIKALNDEGSGTIDDIARGIMYAANNGAQVINLSLGSSNPSQLQQDAIRYAYRRGAIVVAAAGNQSSSDFHYPAADEYVVAVGATGGTADLISSISNYGIYVDVMAPGGDFRLSPPSEMISTVYYNPTYGFNNYYRARTKEGYLTAGTSSSAAMVSGLMALVRSQHPDWTNQHVIQQVVATADNIDALNPKYQGQLGSGRINAYRALSEANPRDVAPRLLLLGEVTISDAIGGDGDHIFERGETVDVTVNSYRNFSVSPARNIIFTLTTDDTDLTIQKGSYAYGYFPPDTTITFPGLFSFSVNPNARGKTAQIYVGWQAEGGFSDADTFDVIIGKIPILVVDDDFDDIQGNDHFPNAEKMYTNILDQAQLNYALWDRHKMGPLGPSQIANFPIVIWLCEWAFPSLDSLDRVAIGHFLDNGGSLFISGQDIGWDFNDPDGYGYAARDFYAKYLHAIYFADDSDVNDVIGLANDPIGDGLQFKVWQPGLDASYQFPDEIEPGPGATAIFDYAGGKNHRFGIKYKGDHKVVYFGMGLEAIDSKQDTPPENISPIRTEVLQRVLNWLNFIDHQPLADTEDLTAPRPVIVHVAKTVDQSDLIRIELNWRKKGEADFNKMLMAEQAPGRYAAEIPGPGETADIEYFIQMVNTYFDWSTPKEAPAKLYGYFVGPDQIAPTFSHVPIKSTINGEVAWPVLVGAKDNSGLDTTSVYLHYQSRSIADSIRLTPHGNPEQFYGLLPPRFAYGDTVRYYFSAYDKANTPNLGLSDTFSFVIGYEDFESGLGNWSASEGGWGLEETPTFSRSGRFSINDSPQEPYPLNRDVSITTNFNIDLSQSQHATLKFWNKVYLELNHDFGYIEASRDGGNSWQQIGSPLNGFQATWKQQTVSLSPFCGPGNNRVRIRFRMTSDGSQLAPFQGWFIDDVEIIEGLDVTPVEAANQAALPGRFALHQNYPNPFNPQTTIAFDLPQPGMVDLKIYNIKGEMVRTLLARNLAAGSYRLQWLGDDERGLPMASGIYFCRLSNGDLTETRKLILLK
ncbi:MAG: S8 family serine peptidase [candidate division KSB1 bacterium]|nr:S8 family serine peptidase [candidate division KSB1 bacterium]